MKILKPHNESPEGNEAIRQLNIVLLKNKIDEYGKLSADAMENCDIEEMEEYDERIAEMEDQLDQLENEKCAINSNGLTGRNIGWILTYNHIDDKVMGEPDRPELIEKFTVPFKLYDDDGELYFTGRMTQRLHDSSEILDPLDYTMNSWGCTEMKIKGRSVTGGSPEKAKAIKTDFERAMDLVKTNIDADPFNSGKMREFYVAVKCLIKTAETGQGLYLAQKRHIKAIYAYVIDVADVTGTLETIMKEVAVAARKVAAMVKATEVAKESQAHEAKLTVKLESCGNPDFGQNPNRPMPGAGRKFVEVGSFKEASEVCRVWIGKHNLGGGNFCGGHITKGGVDVGRVSYNGRVWDMNDDEILIDKPEDSMKTAKEKKYTSRRDETGAFDIPAIDHPLAIPSNPELRSDYGNLRSDYERGNVTMADQNNKFLSSIDSKTKTTILGSIAKHYGITPEEALKEVLDEEAEHLLEYMVEPHRSATFVLMQNHKAAEQESTPEIDYPRP